MYTENDYLENIDLAQGLDSEVQILLNEVNIHSIDKLFTKLSSEHNFAFGQNYDLHRNIFIRSDENADDTEENSLIEFEGMNLLITNPATLHQLYRNGTQAGAAINNTNGYLLLFQSIFEEAKAATDPQRFPIPPLHTIEIDFSEYLLFRSLRTNGTVDYKQLNNLYNSMMRSDSADQKSLHLYELANRVNLVMQNFYKRGSEITKEADKIEKMVHLEPQVEDYLEMYLLTKIQKGGKINYGKIFQEVGHENYISAIRDVRDALIIMETKHQDIALKFKRKSVDIELQIEECNRTLKEVDYQVQAENIIHLDSIEKSEFRAAEIARKLHDFFGVSLKQMQERIKLVQEGDTELQKYKGFPMPKEIVKMLIRALVDSHPPLNSHFKKDIVDKYKNVFRLEASRTHQMIDEISEKFNLSVDPRLGYTEPMYQVIIQELEKYREVKTRELDIDENGLMPFMSIHELADKTGFSISSTTQLIFDTLGLEPTHLGGLLYFTRKQSQQIIEQSKKIKPLPKDAVLWANLRQLKKIIDTHLLPSGKGVGQSRISRIAHEVVTEICADNPDITPEVQSLFRNLSNQPIVYYNLELILDRIMQRVGEEKRNQKGFEIANLDENLWAAIAEDLERLNFGEDENEAELIF